MMIERCVVSRIQGAAGRGPVAKGQEGIFLDYGDIPYHYCDDFISLCIFAQNSLKSALKIAIKFSVCKLRPNKMDTQKRKVHTRIYNIITSVLNKREKR